MYSPPAPASVSLVALVASFMMLTLAAAIAAPLESITVPRMRPPVLCAFAKGAAKRITAATRAAVRMFGQQMVRTCRKRASAFMTSPLAVNNFVHFLFFEVAAPLKPYYNPVNLEKAGTGVKQKEFIHRISEARGASSLAHQRSRAPRRDLIFRVACLGGPWPRHAAAHAKPLSPLYRSRRALAPARDFSPPRSRPQSCRHRSCVETPGRCFRCWGNAGASRSAFPAPANAAGTLPRAGSASHRRVRGVSQQPRARPEALLDRHASPHRPLLSQQHPLAFRNYRGTSPACSASAAKNPGDDT